MLKLGFVQPSGPSHTALGWVHPELGLGFEVVADVPMDGTVHYRRITMVENVADDAAFALIRSRI